MHFHRGEVYRRRNDDGDQQLALADYQAAAASPSPPPPAFRGIGLIARQRGDGAAARHAFERYLELAPAAPDAAFIKAYIAELNS